MLKGCFPQLAHTMAAVNSVPNAGLPMPMKCLMEWSSLPINAHKLPFMTGRWTVAAVDSVPIDTALRSINLTSLPPMDNAWQVPQAAPCTL